jgi:glycosyltransferase involved in cell wall biosynthesis
VTFLGVLDRRSRLPDLYANCDAFVFASVTETLGLVVLEAMASGLPVIAVPEAGCGTTCVTAATESPAVRVTCRAWHWRWCGWRRSGG